MKREKKFNNIDLKAFLIWADAGSPQPKLKVTRSSKTFHDNLK
jgi:hypothetical protein